MNSKLHNILWGVFFVFLWLLCSATVDILIIETIGISALVKALLGGTITLIFGFVCYVLYEDREWF